MFIEITRELAESILNAYFYECCEPAPYSSELPEHIQAFMKQLTTLTTAYTIDKYGEVIRVYTGINRT